MKGKPLRKGDRVKVHRNRGVVYENPNPPGVGGQGVTVKFPDDPIPCICDPDDVVFVSRPRPKRKLDPYTLRWAVRNQRARMRRNGHFWTHASWVQVESLLERLTELARSLERKTKARKR